jgi:hypothetical protein
VYVTPRKYRIIDYSNCAVWMAIGGKWPRVDKVCKFILTISPWLFTESKLAWCVVECLHTLITFQNDYRM